MEDTLGTVDYTCSLGKRVDDDFPSTSLKAEQQTVKYNNGTET